MMGREIVVEAVTADPAAGAALGVAMHLAPLVAHTLARRARLHVPPTRLVLAAPVDMVGLSVASELAAAGVPADDREAISALTAHTRRRLRRETAATVIAPNGCLVIVTGCPLWLLDTVLLHQLALAALLDRPAHRALRVRAIRHHAGLSQLSRRDLLAGRSLARRDRRRATRLERRLPRRLAK